MRLFEGTKFDVPPTCDRCSKRVEECACPADLPTVPPEKQTAKIVVEKRKRGKLVTVIKGLVDDSSLAVLLTTLKTACGAGGTLKDGELEIQGDHSSRVSELLVARGYRIRK